MVTLAFAFCVYLLLTNRPLTHGTVEFDRIRVHRIDLVEADGTQRLIISDRDNFPGSFFHGKEAPRPDRKDSAGLLMLDDEGTEDGGLIFSGRMVNGRPVTAGHLSFDQYGQDQTVSLSRSEEDGSTVSDLVISDQPNWPLTPDTIAEFMRVKGMPDSAAKQSAWNELLQKYPTGHARAILRRAEDTSVGLTLNDSGGRARMRLRVSSNGESKIEFLDAAGHVVKDISATNP